MAGKLSNETLLQQLKHGLAEFELVSSPVLSISSHKPNSPIRLSPNSLLSDNTHRFFARIGSSLGGASPAMKKLERYAVQKVTGDGRCLFRALVKGMAFNKGIALNPREERENADELRMAVKEVLCDNDKERLQYEEALVAITVEESLKRYCQRIGRPDFWGGESELLHTKGGWGSGFIPIAEYGTEFRKGSRKGKSRKVVRLVYSGREKLDSGIMLCCNHRKLTLSILFLFYFFTHMYERETWNFWLPFWPQILGYLD
ncbi:hypothetical protein HYC85_006528 [Camellia sinensis]|uniref:Ubiquitin thioesterase OTU n=1 Tax=Camellia sinensis TaxID=4442 RepID=A0A7J7HLA5_CAMSI|nr:hypothetical protein HYC85_006528 [Camellia sinensis]